MSDQKIVVVEISHFTSSRVYKLRVTSYFVCFKKLTSKLKKKLFQPLNRGLNPPRYLKTLCAY